MLQEKSVVSKYTNGLHKALLWKEEIAYSSALNLILKEDQSKKSTWAVLR